MELFDYLTDEDKIVLKEYIQAYAKVKDVDLSVALATWNKNKKKMFKALGKKLRVKVPINLSMTKKNFINSLKDIYEIPFNPVAQDVKNEPHPFIKDLEEYIENNMAMICTPREYMTYLFDQSIIAEGVCEATLSFGRNDGKTLLIQRGSKIIKSIQKVLKFYKYPRMDLFEKWRNDISNITTKKSIVANLVFSIHPIDFLTMSDNNCGWRSCMSWTGYGGYSTGPIEMMNSNMVIVAYLESNNKKFYFNQHEIPNKSWRCLFYVHKYILLEGKPYPYYSKELAYAAMDELRKLVKANLNWDYQYKNQPYQDLNRYHKNDYVRDGVLTKYLDKHKSILIYMNGMYNDFVSEASDKFLCCRNWVPKTIKINISGLATCMACGKPINSMEEIHDERDQDLDCHGSTKLCYDCKTNRYCDCCNVVISNDKPLYRAWTYTLWRLRTEDYKEVYASPMTVCEECIMKDYVVILDKEEQELAFLHVDNLFNADFIRHYRARHWKMRKVKPDDFDNYKIISPIQASQPKE